MTIVAHLLSADTAKYSTITAAALHLAFAISRLDPSVAELAHKSRVSAARAAASAILSSISNPFRGVSRIARRATGTSRHRSDSVNHESNDESDDGSETSSMPMSLSETPRAQTSGDESSFSMRDDSSGRSRAVSSATEAAASVIWMSPMASGRMGAASLGTSMVAAAEETDVFAVMDTALRASLHRLYRHGYQPTRWSQLFYASGAAQWLLATVSSALQTDRRRLNRSSSATPVAEPLLTVGSGAAKYVGDVLSEQQHGLEPGELVYVELLQTALRYDGVGGHASSAKLKSAQRGVFKPGR